MFEPIDRIDIESDGVRRSIVFAKGDLARIDPRAEVDLLVVSALPGDYAPVLSSVIGQLWTQGISVADLAEDKAMDLRETTGAWMSHPVPDAGFSRLVCFEPQTLGAPPDVVGKLFRALFPFLDDARDQVIAMPLIATGSAGWPVAEMLPPLLEAAVEWLRLGLPVRTLYIVVPSDDHVMIAKAAFDAERNRVEAAPQDISEVLHERPISPGLAAPQRRDLLGSGPFPAWLRYVGVVSAICVFGPLLFALLLNLGSGGAPLPVAGIGLIGALNLLFFVCLIVLIGIGVVLIVRALRRWRQRRRPIRRAFEHYSPGHADTQSLFLSFSSKDAAAADQIVALFAEIAPHIRVFDFRRDIAVGVSYQRKIDAALAESNRVLCILSPDYLASGECEEELMVARLRNKRMGFSFLWPVYWRNVPQDLEDWIMILNLADCREADFKVLRENVSHLCSSMMQLKG